MRLILWLGALLLFSAPLAAQPTPAPDSAEIARIDAELTAYGRWLAELSQIEAPLQAELNQLGPAWQAAIAGDAGGRVAADRFRPVISRMLATADGVNARLRALDPPQFPRLNLDDDLQPRRMRDDLLRLNGEIRTVVAGYGGLLDAWIRNDRGAMEQAGTHMLDSLKLVFRSQIVLARGSLAATPRGEAAWEMGHFQLLFFQTGARIFDSLRPFDPADVDLRLADDLLGFADQLETTARDGDRKIEVELGALTEQLATAQENGNSSAASVFRRVIAVFNVDREYFTMARDMARILRTDATGFSGRPLSQATLARLLERLREIRARIDETVQREQNALANDS